VSEAPVLRFTGGTPSDEELVAVLVALRSLGAAPPETSAPPEPSGWVDRRRAIGAPLTPGPGAWVASARP
jgi:hypothetical protein